VTPTLRGRLQTRVVVALTFGLVWTALVTPMLPHGLASDMSMSGPSGTVMTKFMTMVSDGQRSTLGQDYQMAFITLALMTALGLIWEVLYHGLQQFRWDRDWPPMFVLLAGIPEGAVLWLVLRAVGVTQGTVLPASSVFPMFVLLFASTWVVLLLAQLGPMRVLSVRWRYQGMEVWHRGRRTDRRASVVAPATTATTATTADGAPVERVTVAPPGGAPG